MRDESKREKKERFGVSKWVCLASHGPWINCSKTTVQSE